LDELIDLSSDVAIVPMFVPPARDHGRGEVAGVLGEVLAVCGVKPASKAGFTEDVSTIGDPGERG
jgi:hypothetical protein